MKKSRKTLMKSIISFVLTIALVMGALPIDGLVTVARADGEESSVFEEAKSIDGVKITVSADEGVFPVGAVLSVEKVTKEQEKKSEEAVKEKRSEDQNVAVSYTYDIKVLDKDGNEIQPADESKVKVSFKLEEVADANLTTNVYHIVEEDSQNGGDSGEAAPKEGDNPENSRNEETDAGNSAELTAEKLEVETNGDTATAETDGFSLYTVEFTYTDKQYVLPGDSEVALFTILEDVGLSGEVSEVSVSDGTLFSASKNEGGQWTVTAHKAFSTEEWIKVIIGGVEYEIKVTDNQDPAAKIGETLYGTIPEAITAAQDGATIILLSDVDISAPLVIPSGKALTLDLNGHTIDRGLAGRTAEYEGYVIKVNGGNLTLQDNSSSKTGKITGGNDKNGCGGGVYVDQGTFTMQDGRISENQSIGPGGGVYVADGTFNMTGGMITDNNATGFGGGVLVSGNGTFNVSGAPVISGNFTEGIWDVNHYTRDEGNGRSASDDVALSSVESNNKRSHVTVAGELTSGASIYVNSNVAQRPDTAIVGADNYTIKESDAGCFHCSDDNYVVVLRNGGIEFEQAYAISVEAYNGTIETSSTTAVAGATVTLTITPESEYVLDTLTVTDVNNNSINVSGTGNTRTFTMPAENVTVNASFAVPVAQVGDAKYATVQEAIDAAAANGTVILLSDVNINTFLIIASGKTVTLDLSGNTIDRGLAGKEAVNDGNVITVNGNLTLTDSSTDHTGTITGGNTTGNGGGVYVAQNGTFTMSGGTISGCTATGEYSKGGGVYNDGTFNMEGGSITACSATGTGGDAIAYGGGVYVDSGKTINVSGTPVISGNTHQANDSATPIVDNVFLSSVSAGTATVTVTAALGEDASIGVCLGTSDNIVIARGTDSYVISAGDAEKFHHDDIYYTLVRDVKDGKYVIRQEKANSWSGLQAKLQYGGNTVRLDYDYTAGNSDTALVVPAGRTVTLDLNGHTIDRGLKDSSSRTNGDVITVLGNLTLTDSSADGTGRLTGGNNQDDGGGVNVYSGTFTMEGGSITDCTANSGGGVYVNGGTFTMNGGTISSCTANNGAGGGVKVFTGTFNMTGGTISGCTGRGVFVDGSGMFTMSGGARIDGCTYASGGGVYVNGGTFTMEGSARITGCTATNGDDDAQGGGGVYVYLGTFNVSGSPVISGNKKGDKTNNVVLNGSKTITVTGALTDGAEIRVIASNGSTVAVPGKPSGSSTAYTITAADVAKFHSDDTSLSPGLDDGNVVLKETLPEASLSNTSVEYNGNAFSPTISFTNATLEINTDYTLSYKKVVDTQETALSSAPKDAGSYKLVVAGKGRYAGTRELAFTITQKAVTVSGITVKENKVYDTTTVATVTGTAVIDGKVGNDDVTVSAGTAAFVDANVGNDKAVNFSGFGLTGEDASNYTLSAQPANVTANITPAPITGALVTLNETSMEYNGLVQTVTLNQVTLDEQELFSGVDYEVTAGTSGTDVNVYTVTVTGKGNYQGNATADWEITPKDMTVTAEDVSVSYDGQPHGITVNVSDPESGATIRYGTTEDSYTLEESPTITNVSESGKRIYYQVTDRNYQTFTGSATITVGKADIQGSAIHAPTAISLTYTGSAQELVTAGSVEGGTMYYASGNSATAAPAAGLFTASVPKAINAGTYYVWYKVKGDGNHNDVAAVGTPLNVIIGKSTTPKTISISNTITRGTTNLSINIASYIPTDVGTFSCDGLGGVTKEGNVTVTDPAISSAGVITATLADGKAGDTITIPVTFNSQNYEICTANVTIKLVNPHTHYYTAEVTKEPTCTEDGVRTYKCSCGSAYTEVINAEGHKMTHFEAVEATTEKEGNIEYWICSECGKYFADAEGKTEITEEQTILPKSKHKLTLVPEKKATCTEDGNTSYYTCADCDKLFEDEEGTKEITLEDTVIKAEGHKMTHFEAVEATTEKEGNIEYWLCTECGKYFADAEGKTEITKEQTILPKSKHKLTLVPEKKATCTEDGNTAYYTCADCDKLFEDAEGTKEITLEDTVIKAEGHKLNHVEAVEPTSEKEGNIEYWLCSECGKYFADAEGLTEITEEETKLKKLISISECTITGISNKAWTGSDIKPVVTVKYDGKTLKKGTDYRVTYSNNKNVGTATVTIEGIGDYDGTVIKKFAIKKISLKYRAYVQKKSWMKWTQAGLGTKVDESSFAGTTDDLRMETIQMQLSGVTGAIKYRAYVEKMGWTQWATTADKMTYAGTKGKGRRVEMIQLAASGQVATLYDMYYRTYCEKFGWLGWAGNNEKSGSAGYARKLEAFQVQFVPKGTKFNQGAKKAFYDKTKDGEQ